MEQETEELPAADLTPQPPTNQPASQHAGTLLLCCHLVGPPGARVLLLPCFRIRCFSMCHTLLPHK
jgi:hypothetical protein